MDQNFNKLIQLARLVKIQNTKMVDAEALLPGVPATELSNFVTGFAARADFPVGSQSLAGLAGVAISLPGKAVPEAE